MSKYELNKYHTTSLVLNIMWRIAHLLGLDLNDDSVSDKLYDICCVLESYPDDCDFGGSDAYSYIQQAREVFETPEQEAERLYKETEAAI